MIVFYSATLIHISKLPVAAPLLDLHESTSHFAQNGSLTMIVAVKSFGF